MMTAKLRMAPSYRERRRPERCIANRRAPFSLGCSLLELRRFTDRYPAIGPSAPERCSRARRFRTRASARPSSESAPAETSAAMTSAAENAALAALGIPATCSVSARLQSRMPRLIRPSVAGCRLPSNLMKRLIQRTYACSVRMPRCLRRILVSHRGEQARGESRRSIGASWCAVLGPTIWSDGVRLWAQFHDGNHYQGCATLYFSSCLGFLLFVRPSVSWSAAVNRFVIPCDVPAA